MAAYERRSFSGVAVDTTVAVSIISADTSISIASATGWPTGGNGPFYIVIDPGTASEEIVKIASRSSTTLTVASSGRGSDGTSAHSHTAGAVTYPVATALDFDEANAHLANAQADPHPVYLLKTDATSTYLTQSNASSTYLTQSNATSTYLTQANAATTYAARATFPVVVGFALSDETTAITTGTGKLTWRAPYAFSLTSTRAQVNTASSSGLPTVNIKKNGTTIFSTKLTIDANEKTSVTAATAAVLSSSPTSIADDDEITFDIDVAGTGAKGLKCYLYGTRTI